MSNDEEIVLAGGVANQGLVVRVGNTVRRPAGASSERIRALLLHLESVGFVEAPRFLGVDDAGREVLSYIPGEVGVPPFSAFFASEGAMIEAAGLLRRYHEAARGFDWLTVEGWSDELKDPVAEETLCHNDLCVENVVFRDGSAVGLLDYDFAAPGRSLWDAAMAARMWAPMAHPAHRRAWPDGLDAAARVGVFAEAYGVRRDDAELFVETMLLTHRVGREFVRRHVEANDGGFVEMWRTYGGPDREARDDDWIAANRELLVDAVASA